MSTSNTPTVPVDVNLPDPNQPVPGVDLNGAPDIVTHLNFSSSGIGPVIYKGYRWHGKRLPLWFVVEIITPGASPATPLKIDLYDTGVQGRENDVFVRIKSGAQNLQVVGGTGVAQQIKQFERIEKCGGTYGTPGPCKATIESIAGTCVLECAYCDYADFSVPKPLGMMQPDDGSPPPGRPGQTH